MNAHRSPQQSNKLDFIGDHLALDLVNTIRRVGDEVSDTLHSDEDACVWLRLAGLDARAVPGLLPAARRLRAATQSAVEAHKAGQAPDLALVNDFLSAAHGYDAVVSAGTGLELQRCYPGQTPEEVLGPVSAAVADLLANADFERVRACAGAECVLWFFDRSKSGKRRFCSAAGCGNRAKVAAFRSRAQKG